MQKISTSESQLVTYQNLFRELKSNMTGQGGLRCDFTVVVYYLFSIINFGNMGSRWYINIIDCSWIKLHCYDVVIKRYVVGKFGKWAENKG
jgi:hypothetical protein